MGMWGMIINGVQAAGLEYQSMRTAPWNGGTSRRNLAMCLFSADHFLVGFIFVYTFTMLVLYSECLPDHGIQADTEERWRRCSTAWRPPLTSTYPFSPVISGVFALVSSGVQRS